MLSHLILERATRMTRTSRPAHEPSTRGETIEPHATSSTKVLTPAQVQSFLDDGYVRVPRAFDPKTAEAVCQAVLDGIGADLGAPLKDPNVLCGRRGFVEGFFRYEKMLHGEPATDMNTKRVLDALDDVLGEGAYAKESLESHGLFTMTFPGFSSGPWRAPAYSGNWHIDSGCRYEALFSLESGRCACIPVFLTTRADPTGGATVCIPGSHKVLSVLMKRLGAIDNEQMQTVSEVLASSAERIDTLHGEAGDLIVMHPFLVHSPAANTGSNLRMMSNTGLGLLRGRNYDKYSGPLSPVEQSIADCIYGLQPRHVSVSRLALDMVVHLRSLRLHLANHPTWETNLNLPRRACLELVVKTQAALSRLVFAGFDLKQYRGQRHTCPGQSD